MSPTGLVENLPYTGAGLVASQSRADGGGNLSDNPEPRMTSLMIDRRILRWPHAVIVVALCLWVAGRTGAAEPLASAPRVGSVLQAPPVEFLPGEEAAPIWSDAGAPMLLDEAGMHEGGCDSCGGTCGSCTTACGMGDCLSFYDAWGRVDYLLWWRKGADLPPLVSTGPLTGNNSVLFGGDTGSEIESGGRAEIGFWLDACRERGIVGRYFALGEESIEFNSSGLANVARPFIDVTPGSPAFGMENALVVNAPGGPTGTVNVLMSSEVHGGDVFYRRMWCMNECSRVDFLIGYQTSRFDEDLLISHQLTAGGVTVTGTDYFATENEFHGVELGLAANRRDCRWTLDVLAKVGLGSMNESVTISGVEIREPPVMTTTGSLLALPTNIGSYNQNQFAAVPELNLNMTYQLNDCLDFSVGYSFIYWSHVLRPGDQIDRTVNATQTSGGTLNGQARPDFNFADGEFWVQGINFGLTMQR